MSRPCAAGMTQAGGRGWSVAFRGASGAKAAFGFWSPVGPETPAGRRWTVGLPARTGGRDGRARDPPAGRRRALLSTPGRRCSTTRRRSRTRTSERTCSTRGSRPEIRARSGAVRGRGLLGLRVESFASRSRPLARREGRDHELLSEPSVAERPRLARARVRGPAAGRRRDGSTRGAPRAARPGSAARSGRTRRTSPRRAWPAPW